MPIVNINGVNLNYEITGQGKIVVFLHGMTGSTRDWTKQIAVLSPRYQAVALDMRGHGKAAAPSREDEYSIRLFADDVFGLLRRLGITKCCLVGHSIGGCIALQFALEHQDMLAALVLVDTSSGEVARAPGYAELRQQLEALARSQGMEAAFEYDAANNPVRKELFQKRPELRDLTRQKMLMTSVEGYIYGFRAMGTWEPVTDRLPEIKVPALIYCGEQDLAYAGASQALKERIADSELLTVKGVGHNPHEEAPDFLNETLLKFLGRIKW